MLKYSGREKEDLATDVEALAYLYTAGLSAPLDHDYSEVFMYLTAKSFEWQNKAEIPEFLQGHENLGKDKENLLHRLKRDIWNAQDKIYTERRKSEKGACRRAERNSGFEEMNLF